jgi:hypothetical protein
MFAAMDNIGDRPSTRGTCLAWGNQQDGKHERDRPGVIPTTGGSIGHRYIIADPQIALRRVRTGVACMAIPTMELLTRRRVRCPA